MATFYSNVYIERHPTLARETDDYCVVMSRIIVNYPEHRAELERVVAKEAETQGIPYKIEWRDSL